MNTSTQFQITPLAKTLFTNLFSLTDTELNERGIRRMVADAKPCYPCRISLADAEIGERILLLPHLHQDVYSPYRASGPIFVREAATEAALAVDEVPESIKTRLISFRAYDDQDMMTESAVIEGKEAASQIKRMLADDRVAYLHLHFAGAGCYSCKVNRVS